MKKFGFILLIIMGCTKVQGQSAFHLSGKIIDSTGIPLSHATVSIITQNDTIRILTSDEGDFELKKLSSRQFAIRVTMQGYLPYDKKIRLAADKRSIVLDPIGLRPDYNALDPVTVRRIRPITIGIDTVTYHAAAFPVRDGLEVEDILKILPGIEVTISGDVIVQGKKIGKVLVNGKEFFGGDVLMAIRNLPAAVVDKLQVIDDYGDKARLTGVKSGEPAKVLNIELKQDRRNGEFGQLSSAYGDHQKYADELFGNAFRGARQLSFNGSVSNNSPTGSNFSYNNALNYADQWNPHLGGAISANINAQNPHTISSTTQDNFYPGQLLQQIQNTGSIENSRTSALNGSFTYKPNTTSTLAFNAGVNLQQARNNANADFTTRIQDSGFTKSTTGITRNQSNTTGKSANVNLSYEKILPQSRRRYSVQATVNYTSSRQADDNLSDSRIMTDSSYSSSTLHYLVTNHSDNLNININMNYYMPVGATSFLELGYNAQSVSTNNHLLTQIPVSPTRPPVIIDSLSQGLSDQSLTQIAHAGLNGHFNKTDVSINLNAQPGYLLGDLGGKQAPISYHYFFWNPDLQFARSLDKIRKININYSAHPNLPSLQQFTPYANVANPQYPIIGNPGLIPSFTSQSGIRYEQSALQPTQFQGFGLGINYTITTQTIIDNIIHPKDSSLVVQRTTYVNAGTASGISVDYHLGMPSLFSKSLRITFNGSLSKNRAPRMIDSILYGSTTLSWSQSIHLQWIIPDNIETDLEGNYSVTHAAYPGSGNIPNTFKTAGINWNAKQTLFHHWICTYIITQSYITGGNGLQSTPAILTASLQRPFLAHNMATISINGYNLLDSQAGSGQSSSSTGYTQTKTQTLKRYFSVAFILKLNRFKK